MAEAFLLYIDIIPLHYLFSQYQYDLLNILCDFYIDLTEFLLRVSLLISSYMKAALFSSLNHLTFFFLSLLGSTCCMWCLYYCQRTKGAMKIQLMWLFSLIICSVITLPKVSFIFYNDHQCHFSNSPEARFWFIAINSMIQQMGRATFSSIAFFR